MPAKCTLIAVGILVALVAYYVCVPLPDSMTTIYATFAAGVLFVLVAYHLYEPLPDNIEEPWKLRAIAAGTKIVHDLINIGSKIGYDHPLNLTRKLLPLVFIASAEHVPLDQVKIEEMLFDGVTVRIYTPASLVSGRKYPGLVYYHGGGFIIFNIDTYDKVLRRLAMKTENIIVAVEYRLAPEHPFPTPVQDCIKATIYLMQNAEKFNIDSSKIGVAGDSAGGNLAAAVSLHLANNEPKNTHPIRYQGVIYPMIQTFDFLTPSYRKNADAMPTLMSTAAMIGAWTKYWSGDKDYDYTPFWTNSHTSGKLKKSKYAKFLDHKLLPPQYHGDIEDSKTDYGDEKLSKSYEKVMLDPLYSPIMADDLSKAPPALIVTAEHDVLRDDGLLFAKRLEGFGVPVTLYHRQDGFHAMFSYTRLKIGRDVHEEFQKFIETHTK